VRHPDAARGHRTVAHTADVRNDWHQPGDPPGQPDALTDLHGRHNVLVGVWCFLLCQATPTTNRGHGRPGLGAGSKARDHSPRGQLDAGCARGQPMGRRKECCPAGTPTRDVRRGPHVPGIRTG
jgi:hypothetical protein